MTKRTKFLLGIGVIAALVIGWQVAAYAAIGPIGTAQGFEDNDGDLAANDATINFDWNSFDSVTWSPSNSTTPTRQTEAKTVNGFQFKGIEDYPNPGEASGTTADNSFNGGTKQDTNCPGVRTNKPPDKDDLTRIYLASKIVNGDVFLDLAWVRISQNSTSSSAHVGFEFNQGTTSCGAGSGGLVNRQAGDILIVYDFEGGDSPVKLTLRKWVTNPSATCEVGSSSPPCWGTATLLTQTPITAEGDVNNADVTDALSPPALGTNPGTSVDRTLETQEFGEAGINLTDAAGIGQCSGFGKAYAVSRSSGNSDKAQMKDLVGPADFNLGNCTTNVATAQSFIPNDSATITGTPNTAGTFTGKVDFRLFGGDTCSGTVLFSDLSNPLPQNSSGTVSTTNSGDPATGGYTINAAKIATDTPQGNGVYSWQVIYNAGGTDDTTHPESVTCKEVSTLTINNNFTPTP